ncbi:MAG TPA: beta-galactosidase trimerization domain-containing protein, partial [Rhodoglobus sp.]|nr:beta-galactosidase trimerization domain-containing protein [Rhodoglobus sp.]
WQIESAIIAMKKAGAEVMGTYLNGPGAGMPAITRNRHGAGVGWYVSTRLAASGLAQVMKSVYADAGITAADLPAGVEVIRRRGEEHDYVTVINHSDSVASVPVSGFDLVGQSEVSRGTPLAAGAVAIVRTTT